MIYRKERQLRADIAELQQRVAEAEARAEEMSGAVSAATRPLLRQMENLQATHSSQQASWESLEVTLTQRLSGYIILLIFVFSIFVLSSCKFF